MRTCCHEGYKERRYCPYCHKGIWCKDGTLEDHQMRTQFSTTNNYNLELPQEAATMKLNNFEDMLTRPFIAYADFEAS
jgi:Zn-finger nucleic acid-binding protein